MAIRLKSYKQMHDAGLLPWSRPKVEDLIRSGDLPAPAIFAAGRTGHLWDEAAVEQAVARIVAAAKERNPELLERQRAQAARAQRAKATAA